MELTVCVSLSFWRFVCSWMVRELMFNSECVILRFDIKISHLVIWFDEMYRNFTVFSNKKNLEWKLLFFLY